MVQAQEFAGSREIGGKWGRMARFFGATLMLAALSACSRPADEQALRDSLAAMQLATEQRSSDDFLEHVAEDFAAANGMRRDDLRRLLALQFMRNASVGATLGPVEVRIEGERAQTDFKLLLTGSSGGLIPERADGYTIEAGWRVEDGRWLLERADWR